MDSINAIYEDGVFKPTGPVSLPEHTEVMIPVPKEGSEPLDQSTEQDTLAKQQAAWRDLFEKINADPRCAGPEDGWSVANNADDVLYGGPDGPA